MFLPGPKSRWLGADFGPKPDDAWWPGSRGSRATQPNVGRFEVAVVIGPACVNRHHLASDRSSRGGDAREGQREGEARAASPILGANGAAVRLDHSLGDREPKPAAAGPAAPERLENAIQVGGCDRGPVIFNPSG